jgi:uncharacterized membrane protein YoaK (UPF0700 family)
VTTESLSGGPSVKLVPPLMILTFTTGLIDAVSFVGLGQVFTANMTGNVVFIGFAIAGVEGLSVERSLVSLAAFAAGALVGGRLFNRSLRPPARQFAIAAAAEAALLAAAAGFGFGQFIPLPWYTAHGLIVLTAVAMGLRNAVVRKLAVPDITTTVLTLTVTGLAADSPIAGGTGTRSGRKVLSIILMFAGALAGALMLRSWGFAPTLALAAALAGVVSLMVTWQLKRR